MDTSYPKEGVKETTTVQPEGDLGAAGGDRESLSPAYMPRRRPEPLTGPTSQEGYRQTAQAESNGCQGGPIHDPASEQHHRGVHGPSVLPEHPHPDASWSARDLRLHLAKFHADATSGLVHAEMSLRHGAYHIDPSTDPAVG